MIDLQKTEEEIQKIKESSLLVGKTLGEIAKLIRPGITTAQLDKIAEEFIFSHGAMPAFKGYRGYPATLCVSINDEVVHGIPSDRVIQEGDIVSVDCGVYFKGYFGDYAYTFIVGDIDEKARDLVRVTYEALQLGIREAIAGNHLGDIGNAIQTHVEKHGFSVVRDLVGHGIGKNLHEKPEVPNYGKKHKGMKLMTNMVLCIEPMINMGTYEVYVASDGWTIKTKDRKPSAHFEHMVVVRDQHPEVISTYEFVEKNYIWPNKISLK
ncbi:MAG: type I methionyl aminopeptidase [Bacteroidales bacterium]|nr:type I methionyl aminopeptidase [Bacteroidales bacterium]